MKQLILALIFGAIAPTVQADIRLKIDEIAKGSSVTYLLEDGTRQTHHFEGNKTNDTYEVTYWKGRGKGLDAGVEAVGRFDAMGRMLSGKRVTGQWMTFAPHNCFRVLGECRYTATRADGRVWNLGRRQQATEDGFTFETFSVKGNVTTITSRGAVTLDEKGMMQTLTFELGKAERYKPMTQESADYR